MKQILFLLILLLPLISQAQRRVTVNDVMGECVVAEDLSVVQARDKAIQLAKVEALRRAGVPEFVSEVNILQKSEKSTGDFSELFNSLTSQEVSGEISAYTIRKEEKTTDQFGNFIIRIRLDAEVVIHERRTDPTFYATVNGIRENYFSKENLTFQIRPAGTGYLNVFIIDEKEGSHLFPNTLERSEKLEANRTYTFPVSKALDYEVSTTQNVEVNYVVILFTKREVLYTEDTTVPSLLNFVARISPSEKFVKVFPIVIKKQL